MALITTATIAALQTTVNKRFREGFTKSSTFQERFVTTLPSNSRVGTYTWMDTLPIMREWVGPRTLNNLSNTDYQLTNKNWESTIACDRDDIEDDVLGVFANKVEMLGDTAAKHVDRQAVWALQNGTSELCFDGLSFFNDAHTLDPAGTQDNNFASTALNATNYASTRQAMMSYTDADGQPLGIMPNLLVVPPQLEDEARTILNAEFVAVSNAGVTNIWRNSADLLVIPELANQATTWYLMDVSKPIKPLIWQQRRPVQLVSMTAPTDEAVFTTRQYRWGLDSRGAIGYSLWFLAARCIA